MFSGFGVLKSSGFAVLGGRICVEKGSPERSNPKP